MKPAKTKKCPLCKREDCPGKRHILNCPKADLPSPFVRVK